MAYTSSIIKRLRKKGRMKKTGTSAGMRQVIAENKRMNE